MEVRRCQLGRRPVGLACGGNRRRQIDSTGAGSAGRCAGIFHRIHSRDTNMQTRTQRNELQEEIAILEELAWMYRRYATFFRRTYRRPEINGAFIGSVYDRLDE